MSQVLAALATATVGLVASVGGTVMAAASSSDFGPWAQVGGTATAVGALAYVAKLLADGRLVAQPISELVKAATVRQDRLEALIEDAQQREDALRLMLMQRGEKGAR